MKWSMRSIHSPSSAPVGARSYGWWWQVVVAGGAEATPEPSCLMCLVVADQLAQADETGAHRSVFDVWDPRHQGRVDRQLEGLAGEERRRPLPSALEGGFGIRQHRAGCSQHRASLEEVLVHDVAIRSTSRLASFTRSSNASGPLP